MKILTLVFVLAFAIQLSVSSHGQQTESNQPSPASSVSTSASKEAVGHTNAPPKDLTCLLVEPGEFFWRINSIAVEWHVERSATEGSSSTGNWSFENSSEFFKKMNVGTRFDAGHNVKVDLGLLPRLNASIYANVGVWAEGSLSWGSSQQKQARRCFEAFSKRNEERRAPKVTFSIWFYNKSTNDYEIVSENVPICINENEHVAYAIALPELTTDSKGHKVITIPARRPNGVPIKFVAELDNTKAQQLVTYMEDNSPQITLDNSQVKIHKRGEDINADMIPDLEELKNNSVPLSIKTDATLVSWRIRTSTHATLDTIFDAINKKIFSEIKKKRWINYGNNGIIGIADVTNSPSQEWKYLVNGEEVKMGDPAKVVVDQPIQLCLFLTPPPIEPQRQVTNSTPDVVEAPHTITVERYQLTKTWKWNESDRTIIGTLNYDGSAYLENKADNPGFQDIANGKGTWSLNNTALTVTMNKVGRFGVYVQYGPIKWIDKDDIVNITENQITLKSGKTLTKQ